MHFTSDLHRLHVNMFLFMILRNFNNEHSLVTREMIWGRCSDGKGYTQCFITHLYVRDQKNRTAARNGHEKVRHAILNKYVSENQKGKAFWVLVEKYLRRFHFKWVDMTRQRSAGCLFCPACTHVVKKVNVDNMSRQSQLALLVPTSQKIYDDNMSRRSRLARQLQWRNHRFFEILTESSEIHESSGAAYVLLKSVWAFIFRISQRK